jgi:DNA-binding transcriptional MerR regulator
VGETGDIAPTRLANEPASAYRTIGEVAEELDLTAQVLRFWESKFPQLQPLKRSGGRRYYRPEDVVLLRRIRECLYQEGYTIRAVQKLLNAANEAGEDETVAQGAADAPTLFPLDPVPEPAPVADEAPAKPARRKPARRLSPEVEAALAEIRRELIEARDLLGELTRPGKRS